MDTKSATAYSCPPASASGSLGLQFPGVRNPSLDERLVTPETREEMLRGELIQALPALPPHADQHFDLDYVIGGYVADGYIGSTDLLTRAGPRSDFATDTAVRKAGIDPATGARYLEELAFEVVSTQSLRDITLRAEDLMERGVRRLFAIFVHGGGVKRGRVERGEVCEWSRDEHRFVPLGFDDHIEDPTLARPLPVRALLDRAQADNAVVDALDSKGNPRLRAVEARGLERGHQRGRKQGLEQGRMEAVEVVCRIFGIELTAKRRAHLQALDAGGLDRLLKQLETQRRWPS